MSDEKEKRLTLSTGNWISIGVFLFSAVMAWAKIQVHISDDSIHLNDGEITLTVDEYKGFLNFATTITNKAPLIDFNHEKIIEMEKNYAVHETEYNILLQEHDDLESKVSRIHKELNDEITYVKFIYDGNKD